MLDNEAVRGPNRNPIALRDAGIARKDSHQIVFQ